MLEVCEKCGGAGMVLGKNAAGVRVARVCECQLAATNSHRLSQTRIPPRYEHCSFESFDPKYPGADASLGLASLKAQSFIHEFPIGTDGRGLLLTGTIGVGKTHLAVSVLRTLVEDRGARGIFWDYRELLKEIQHSYNPQVNSTELDILKPVFDAEVLVLDELGAQKPTDWVWDMVALILNTRYNKKRTTIITSNFPDFPPGGGKFSPAQNATREETLGDRISERMRSRLAEMCVAIEMRGKDFRQVKKASFAFV